MGPGVHASLAMSAGSPWLDHAILPDVAHLIALLLTRGMAQV